MCLAARFCQPLHVNFGTAAGPTGLQIVRVAHRGSPILGRVARSISGNSGAIRLALATPHEGTPLALSIDVRLIRVLAVVAIGALALGATSGVAMPLLVLAAISGLVLAVVAARERLPLLLAVAMVLLMAAAGAVRGHLWALGRAAAASWVAAQTDDSAVTIEGLVGSDAQAEPGITRFTVAVDRVDNTSLRAPIETAVYVSGEIAAAAARDWTKGRRLRATGDFDQPTTFRNFGLTPRHGHLSVRALATFSVKSAALVEMLARAPPWEEASARVRAHIRQRIDQYVRPHGGTAAAVAGAILIGERSRLDPRLVDRMQRAGIYHVMALSGGNVALLLGAVVWLRHVNRAARWLWALCAGTLLVSFAAVVAAEASVVRAVCVAAVYVCAAGLDVRAQPVHVLAVVATGMTLWDPGTVFDVGAWMTFVATLGLLVLPPRLLSKGERWGWRGLGSPDSSALGATIGQRVARHLVMLAAASVCAELALWPITAFVFGQVSLLGIALNFAAIPLMAVVQTAAAVVAFGASQVAPASAAVVHLAVEALQATASVADLWPWLAFSVTGPTAASLGVYYVLLGGWAAVVAPTGRLAGLCALACAAWMLLPPLASQVIAADAPAAMAVAPLLTMTVLDVGQGDATLVQFPSGHTLLVDAGGLPGSGLDVGERVVRPALAALGVHRLSHAAFSHGDPDHIGGFGTVLRRLRPGEVWEGISVDEHAPSLELRREAMAAGSAWRRLQAGDVVWLGDVELRVVHPRPADWARVRVRNDDSIVLVVRYGSVALVLPGDIGASVESGLAEAGPLQGDLRIVKVPHHGSRTSSSAPWIRWTRPKLAIVSAGRGNRYGHPHSDVVGRYRSAGAVVLRTDQQGAIRLRTDGSSVEVDTVAGARLSVASPSVGVPPTAREP